MNSKKLYGLDWFRKIGEKSAQEFVLNNLKENNVVIKRHTTAEGHQWAQCDYESLKKIIMKNRQIYEIITMNNKTKVFFDIDGDKDILEDCKKVILKQFKDAKLQISGYETETKFSYHIILSNYYFDNDVDVKMLKHWVSIQDDALCFDKKVYTKNRALKCINQSKPDGEIQKWISGSTTLSKHLVLFDFDNDAINISHLEFKEFEEFKKSLPKENELSVKIDLTTIKQQHFTNPEDFDFFNASPVEKLNIIPLYKRGEFNCLEHSNIWKIMVWCKDSDISYEEFWEWNKQKENTLVRKKKWEEKWINCNVHMKTETINHVIKRFYPFITQNNAVKRQSKQFELQEEYKNEIKYLQKQFLDKDDIDKNIKTTILAPNMMGNKTGATVDYIVDFLNTKLGLSILWITPRITLAKNTLSRLDKAGVNFVNYKDLNAKQKQNNEIDKHNLLLCSVESLHYIGRDYDLVIIDEIESVLTTFKNGCKTHITEYRNNLNANWTILKKVLKNCKKLIVIDAFLTKLSVEFIKKFGNFEIIYTVDENGEFYKGVKRVFQEVDDYKNWVALILRKLKEGKKLYIYVPFRFRKNAEGAVENLNEIIKRKMKYKDNVNIISYHGEKTAEKKKLINCEKIWSNEKVRCVITNSCISVGVNFNIKDIFDNVFCYFTSAMAFSTRDFFQALFRVRCLKSSIMYLYRPSSLDAWIMRDLCYKETIDITDLDFLALRRNLDIEYQANLPFNNNPKSNWENFNLFLSKTNIEYRPAFLLDEKITLKTRNEIKDLLKNTDNIFSYKNIKDIDAQDLETLGHLVRSNQHDLDIILLIEKYRFKKTFKNNTDEKDLERIWDNNETDFFFPQKGL